MAWHETFFDETYLRTDTFLQDPERIKNEVEGVIRLLGLKGGERILDAPCGFGRHSVELARRGFAVTGVDASAVQLEEARRRQEAVREAIAGAEGSLSLQQQDIRRLPFQEEFDVALNLFTSFGYFDEEGDRRTMECLARALVPGGRLLLETIHRDNLLRRFQARDWGEHQGPRLMSLEERSWDPVTSRISTRRLVVESGEDTGTRVKEYPMDLRLYTIPEMEALARGSGLELERAAQDWSGAPVTLESSRLILIFRKGLGGNNMGNLEAQV